MEKSNVKYDAYIRILEEELVPAMGCTEPIAIAYGAAKGREVLGALPDQVVVEASGNIIKNVKSVVVPNTGGLHGIEAAAAAGVVAAAGGHLSGYRGAAGGDARIPEGAPRPGGVSGWRPGL